MGCLFEGLQLRPGVHISLRGTFFRKSITHLEPRKMTRQFRCTKKNKLCSDGWQGDARGSLILPESIVKRRLSCQAPVFHDCYF